MERENIVNANKLRRIKERLEQGVLEQRVTDNLPVFEKVWREEIGPSQNEFCRLQKILQKDRATSLLNNANGELNPASPTERPRSQNSQFEATPPSKKETSDAEFSPGFGLNQSNASEN